MRQGQRKARIEERHFQYDGVSIHYQVAGHGEPVVLIHGLSGSGRWWRRNVEPLARRFRVHVVDLVGFGLSRDGRFVLHDAASHLTAWLDSLGIERAHVIGHSMGGAIAADLAADFPARVGRLVLVDAAAVPFNRTYLQHALGLLRGLCYLPLGFLPVLAADACRAGPLTLLQAARDLLSADLTAKLPRIQAPARLIWGERDFLVPLELGRELCRSLRHADLVVIEGAGHNPMWDRPTEFNRAVLEFLAADSASLEADSAVYSAA